MVTITKKIGKPNQCAIIDKLRQIIISRGLDPNKTIKLLLEGNNELIKEMIDQLMENENLVGSSLEKKGGISIPSFSKAKTLDILRKKNFSYVDPYAPGWLKRSYPATGNSTIESFRLAKPLNTVDIVEKLGGKDYIKQRLMTPQQIDFIVGQQLYKKINFLAINTQNYFLVPARYKPFVFIYAKIITYGDKPPVHMTFDRPPDFDNHANQESLLVVRELIKF